MDFTKYLLLIIITLQDGTKYDKEEAALVPANGKGTGDKSGTAAVTGSTTSRDSNKDNELINAESNGGRDEKEKTPKAPTVA